MNILETSVRPVSMDAPISDNDDTAMIDVVIGASGSIATDRQLETESLQNQLGFVLSKLPEREEQILRMAFGIGQPEGSLEEIAVKVGLSKERVRQLREKAIRTLQGVQSRELLRAYI